MSPWWQATNHRSTSVRDGMKAILCLQKTGTASVWFPKSIQKVAWAYFVCCQSCNHFADTSTIQTTGIFKITWLQKPWKYRKTRVSTDGQFAKIKIGKKSQCNLACKCQINLHMTNCFTEQIFQNYPIHWTMQHMVKHGCLLKMLHKSIYWDVPASNNVILA
jgi:hypothetical protein